MKVYLASQYERRDEIQERGELLASMGNVQVTSRWHGQIEEEIGVGETGQKYAMLDREDLFRADATILFTDYEPEDLEGWKRAARGGRHTEFGMAEAAQKRRYVVGPRTNVFHSLPGVRHFEQWEPYWVWKCLQIDETWLRYSRNEGRDNRIWRCYSCGYETYVAADMYGHLVRVETCMIPEWVMTPLEREETSEDNPNE